MEAEDDRSDTYYYWELLKEDSMFNFLVQSY